MQMFVGDKVGLKLNSLVIGQKPIIYLKFRTNFWKIYTMTYQDFTKHYLKHYDVENQVINDKIVPQ